MTLPWIGAKGVRRPPLGKALKHDKDLERSSLGPKAPRVPKFRAMSLKQLMGMQ